MKPYGIWRYRTGSTLAQLMACYPTAPSHYLKTMTNHQWGIITESSFTGNTQDIYSWFEFENYQFKITATSPWGQWVNKVLLHKPGKLHYGMQIKASQRNMLYHPDGHRFMVIALWAVTFMWIQKYFIATYNCTINSLLRWDDIYCS